MRTRVRRAAAAAVVAVGMAAALVASSSSIELPAVADQIMPAGFWWTEIDTGLGDGDLLTDFDYLPDGSVISLGKNGKVTWAPAGRAAGGSPHLLASFDVWSYQDSGLVGIAVAHDYQRSRLIHLAMAQPDEHDPERHVQRVTTWRVDGEDTPTGLTQVGTVLETPGNSSVHGIMGLLAGDDGTLWVSMGDNAQFINADPYSQRAQDLDKPNGKLMRVRPDGRGVPDNPYYDAANPSSWRSRVYAYGFRSPFRFTLDPRTGAPIVGDVGWNRWEWIDLVREPGGNYGWPCWDAKEPAVGHRDDPRCAGVTRVPPLWVYGRESGASVTGGIVYTGDHYPAEYQGAYFFGDYHSSRMWTMKFDPDGRIVRAPEVKGFGNDVGGPVRYRMSPDGHLVMGDIFTGQLRQLNYVEGNRPPAAELSITVDAATRTVRFDASESLDLDDDPLSYAWDFGDGSTGTGVIVEHQYAADVDSVDVTLTVTDTSGAASDGTVRVAPGNHPPQLTLDAPPAGTQFAVGDPVELAASATDAEDGELPVRWAVTLVHCRGEVCHNHHGQTVEGPRFRDLFPNHEDNSHLDVTVTATDQDGVSTSKTFRAQPKLRKIILDTNLPDGADGSAAVAMTINGEVVNEALVIVNATVTFAAPVEAVTGERFVSWSDYRARVRNEFTMPDEDVVLSATYR